METLRVLGVDGRPERTIDWLSEADLVELYRRMVFLRVFDERAVALQRQGRIGTYPLYWGEEGVLAGSELASRPGDWLFPSYRQHALALLRGLPVHVSLLLWNGHPAGQWDPHPIAVAPPAIPLATQIPHAVGFALASKWRGEDHAAIAYFGEGSTSEGDFHEGANLAGVTTAPIVLLCTNNQWAISTPVSRQMAADSITERAVGYGMRGIRVDGFDPLAVHRAVSGALERARTGGGPTLVEAFSYRVGPHATADNPDVYRTSEEADKWRDREPVARLERYLRLEGLLDDDSREKAWDAARGELAAGIEKMEAYAPPDPEDAVRHAFETVPRTLLVAHQAALGNEPPPIAAPLPPGPELPLVPGWNMVDALNRALHDAMGADDRVVVFGEDVAVNGGVFRVTAGLLDAFGETRVHDMPDSESGFVGAGVGMCLAGLVPVIEIQFDAFVYPALEQLFSHVGRYRWRTGGAERLQMVVRMPSGGGARTPELHSDSPEALFCHMPGFIVASPSSPADAYAMLRAAITQPDPVIFFEPKRLYRLADTPVPSWAERDRGLTGARLVREGGDATVVTYGAGVVDALHAAERLRVEGVQCTVLDLRVLWPLDEEAILEAAGHTGRVVIVHDAPRSMGVGAEVAAVIAERGLLRLLAPVQRVCGFDAPYPLFQLETHYLPGPARIAETVRHAMAFR